MLHYRQEAKRGNGVCKSQRAIRRHGVRRASTRMQTSRQEKRRDATTERAVAPLKSGGPPRARAEHKTRARRSEEYTDPAGQLTSPPAVGLIHHEFAAVSSLLTLPARPIAHTQPHMRCLHRHQWEHRQTAVTRVASALAPLHASAPPTRHRRAAPLAAESGGGDVIDSGFAEYEKGLGTRRTRENRTDCHKHKRWLRQRPHRSRSLGTAGNTP